MRYSERREQGTVMNAPSNANPSLNRALRLIGGVILGWLGVALLSSAQGYVLADSVGRSKPWWPSFGYAVAIFSVWALLTPFLMHVVRRIGRAGNRIRRLAQHVLAFCAFTALHLAIFVSLYWPVYGGATASPLEMARPVLLANIDTAVAAYALLVLVTHFTRSTKREEAAVEAEAASTRETGLWIRSSGTCRFVAFEEIDWIGAAGDYAEIHARGSTLLADRSLSDLSSDLPRDAFARVHRSTIIRLDRVRQIEGIGRGDARLTLTCGTALRLSRRYRDNLMKHVERH